MPQLRTNKSYTLSTEDETRDFARHIAATTHAGDVIFLEGVGNTIDIADHVMCVRIHPRPKGRPSRCAQSYRREAVGKFCSTGCQFVQIWCIDKYVAVTSQCVGAMHV